ncbi:FecR family protein [Aridibaculum aurantiacum]|uniref:FecR family protein n=1 Tax=Aridibaculum aurantiacum TaxID=2810307 RepID=UPI001A96265F|nr:FecR family protein [Aridibaculum aurantiacum]
MSLFLLSCGGNTWMDNEQNDIYLLIARCLSGEATDMERQALHEAMRNDDQLQQQYELMQRMWGAKGLTDTTAQQTEQKLGKIFQQAVIEDVIEKSARRKAFTRKINLAVAAVFILTVCGTWFFQQPKLQKNQTAAVQMLKTENGSRSRNVLPDGSVVWLNGGSTLRILPKFNQSSREVAIEGEGYFEVVKSKKPFIVHVRDLKLTVLGTAFNVKFFPSDKTIETTLITGSLKVTRTGQKEVVLKPKEKIVLDEEPVAAKAKPALEQYVQSLEMNHPSEIVETAWIFNKLEFRGDNFETLASKMERWYNVEITFQDERLKKMSFNGSFQDETIEQALQALQIVAPFTYKIEDNEILIGSPK